jgi:hypothetical protein
MRKQHFINDVKKLVLLKINELRHDKTNIMGLRPAWFQTSLRIRAIMIRIHAVRLQTLLQLGKLIANSTDPDQTARMRRLVWIHAGGKPIMLVLSWRGSNTKK